MSASISELNDRIAILRANIREMLEQGTAASGAQEEEIIMKRLGEQNDELERLAAEREILLKSEL